MKESPRYAWKFNRNFVSIRPDVVYRLLMKYKQGTLDMENEKERAFYQFMKNGGETGYTSADNIEKKKKLIKKYVRMKDATIPVELAWNLLGEKLDDINRAVENCARFSAKLSSASPLQIPVNKPVFLLYTYIYWGLSPFWGLTPFWGLSPPWGLSPHVIIISSSFHQHPSFLHRYTHIKRIYKKIGK